MRKILILCLAVLFVSSCVDNNAADSGNDIIEKKDFKITIGSHFANVPAWLPVQRGIDDAAALFGITVNVVGPTDFNIQTQITLLEGAIAAGVDAIGTTMPDTEAFNNLTKEALSRGIPVIAFNADAPNSGRLAYVGQGNYEAGYAIGKEIALSRKSGKVAIVIHSPDAINLAERARGVQEALSESGDFTFSTINATKDLVQANSLVGSWIQANKDVIAMVGVEEVSGIAIKQVIEREGLGEQIIGVSFDLIPEVLEGIQNGSMDFTIDQQLYMQGFYTVSQLYHNLVFGLTPANIDSGTAIINKDNVSSVIDLAQKGYR